MTGKEFKEKFKVGDRITCDEWEYEYELAVVIAYVSSDGTKFVWEDSIGNLHDWRVTPYKWIKATNKKRYWLWDLKNDSWYRPVHYMDEDGIDTLGSRLFIEEQWADIEKKKTDIFIDIEEE